MGHSPTEPWATVQGFCFSGLSMPIRTVVLVDGFNLYHAVNDLRANHLKWLDLRALCAAFTPHPQYDLTDVLYFTAYATWLPGPHLRHKAYTRALEATGVTVKLAHFKRKERRCHSCGNTWNHHEEKETDVSIGVALLDLAYRGAFDRAILLTNDSDIKPAVDLTRSRFPTLEVRMLTPPGRKPSHELATACGAASSKIKRVHLDRALLPARVACADGTTVIRPVEYDPP